MSHPNIAHPNRFVVTTSLTGKKGLSKSQIWNTEQPLAIGHPFRYVFEQTDEGIRVRSLQHPKEVIYTKPYQLIPNKDLKPTRGTTLDLDSITVHIKPVQNLDPVFETTQGDHLTVFSCIGQVVLTSTPLEGSQIEIPTPQAHREKQGGVAFILKVKKDEYQVIPKLKTLKFGTDEKQQPLTESTTFTKEKLQKLCLSFTPSDEGSGAVTTPMIYSWRFGFLDRPNLPQISVKKLKHDYEWVETRSFYKTLKGTLLAIAGILILSWLLPKPKIVEQEVIPPQFAKLVLQKTQNPTPPSAGEPAAAAAKNAPKAVKETKIVKAFQNQALQSVVSSLLKGGMTKLLAQSNLASGLGQTTKQILSKTSATLSESTGELGKSNPNVAVTALGGKEGSVGYGKGEYAKVAGQGGKFVSTDIGSISVEEGLSKDEVGAVIHKHMSEVRYCYEASLLRMPNVEGKLMLNFVIGANGMVKTTEIKSSTLPDPRLDDCIIRRLVTWKFPNPKGGVDVAVTYPFIFKSLGK